MGEHAVEGRAAAGSAAFQERGLEPAAMLVRAFQIEIRRPLGIGPALQGEGVGGAGIEPHIEDVLDLFIGRRIMVGAEKIRRRTGEPGVGAGLFHGRHDASVHRGVAQGDAGRLVHEHSDGRAPGALARDQPVGAVLHHAADAVAAGLGIEAGGVDGFQRPFAQGGPVAERLVHADEPLRSIPEDHRGLGAPGVRVGVLQPAAGEQAPGLDQLLHHRAIGRAELAGLLALGLQDGEAGEQRHVGIVAPVLVHHVGDVAMTVGQPDLIVLLAVARGGVHEAGAGVVGDVVAGQQRHVEAKVGIKPAQGVGAGQVLRQHIGDAGPVVDLGRGLHILGQLVGHDQLVADL